MQLVGRSLDFAGVGSSSEVAPALGALVGDSAVMKRLRETVARVASSDRTVLVLGPTGSGKELVVRAIHALSPNSAQSLVALNCGAIPGTLIESELFGRRRGAFTGADSDRSGLLAAAGNGTLFLDEIAELPHDLQSTLLRVLETRKFRAVGSVEEEAFHGRLVAATHADLHARVHAGAFREDLYFRLNVLTVHVPSLDQRREDIPALVNHFVCQQQRPLRFTPCAVELLSAMAWPGNVRQLFNTLDRVAVMAENEVVDAAELVRVNQLDNHELARSTALTDLIDRVMKLPVADKLKALEACMIEDAMAKHHGNKSAAARSLGVHRKRLERLIASHARKKAKAAQAPSGSASN